ncbi:hypothetical protein ILUMI_14292 [Ignelater luminosus]|uniref:Uncharacterized protein n=1 Tax=Ignelater luminosus TaxID=2038154 RepID=A0A8K0GAK8_IGNLU|nr:hypothetical protein ILUMI_14292 [Ignelater luminosus]
METEHKIENNNQNSNIQTDTVGSCQTIQQAECSTNGIYICVPRIHAVYSMRSVHNFPKIRPNGKVTSTNHMRSKPSTEINENAIIYESSIEEPIDLTCTVKRDSESRATSDNASLLQNTSSPKMNPKTDISTFDFQQNNFTENEPAISRKKGRKRKFVFKNPHLFQNLQIPTLESGILKNLENPDLLQGSSNSNDNRQAEVLKAAKSLFSKRTRTLFHWIYPHAPKAQLKAAVASSWETLGEQEKEFYISQVLGRFGFPQTNLMVNPQLGGLAGILPLPPLDLSNRMNQEGNEETSSAVSGLLMSESGSTQQWMNLTNASNSSSSSSSSSSTSSSNRLPYIPRMSRKRGRLGRPPGSRNRKQIKEEFPILKQIRDEPNPDEFQDDPELSREFQQFRWTLHLNDNKT